MTDYKEYIRALKKCAMEHENDTTSTGNVIVSDLCRDTAKLLEGLLESLSDPDLAKDCISRKQVLHWLENATDESIENALNNNLDFIPPVTSPTSRKTLTEQETINSLFTEFKEKLSKWLFLNSESVRGDSMIDIDYLEGHIDEMLCEMGVVKEVEIKND